MAATKPEEGTIVLMNAAFAAFAAIVGCLVGGLWYVTMRPKRQAEFLDNARSAQRSW